MVEEHFGQIKIENNKLGGASISIMLPIEKIANKPIAAINHLNNFVSDNITHKNNPINSKIDINNVGISKTSELDTNHLDTSELDSSEIDSSALKKVHQKQRL